MPYVDQMALDMLNEHCANEKIRAAILSAPDLDYQPKTDEQIHEIALGAFHGHIWVRPAIDQETAMMFMPLGFMTQEQRFSLIKLGANLYEDISKAGPRSVNGLPSFFSMNILSMTDAIKVFNKMQEFRQAVEAVSGVAQ